VNFHCEGASDRLIQKSNTVCRRKADCRRWIGALLDEMPAQIDCSEDLGVAVTSGQLGVWLAIDRGDGRGWVHAV
jgi:hypothetical protein